MRPSRIEIPGMPEGCAKAVERYLHRPSARRADREPYVFRGSDGREMRRPGIQGFACIFDKAFQYEGQIVMFTNTAFAGVRWSGPKSLRFDHKNGRSYGCSDDGLEFENSLEGLAFRMPLDGEDGRVVYENIVSRQRACVSVGCNLDESEVRTIAGHKVKIVHKASLDEISLVREGAVPKTAAWVVDLAHEDPSLWSACRKTSFAMAKSVANVSAAGQRIIDAIQHEVSK